VAAAHLVDARRKRGIRRPHPAWWLKVLHVGEASVGIR
jgi:hypothetical protein